MRLIRTPHLKPHLSRASKNSSGKAGAAPEPQLEVAADGPSQKVQDCVSKGIGKTAGMGENQAKLPNTGMRSGGNTGKGLEADQGDSSGISIPVCPQNTGNGLCFPAGSGGAVGIQGRSGEGVFVLWVLAGNCVDPDRIHHSKKNPMDRAPLPKKGLEKKKELKIFR